MPVVGGSQHAPIEYSTPAAQVIGSAYWALTMLIGISMLIAGDGVIFATCLVLVSAVLAWRTARHTRVSCRDGIVRLCSLLRTRTFRIDEVERVEVRSGQTG